MAQDEEFKNFLAWLASVTDLNSAKENSLEFMRKARMKSMDRKRFMLAQINKAASLFALQKIMYNTFLSGEGLAVCDSTYQKKIK